MSEGLFFKEDRNMKTRYKSGLLLAATVLGLHQASVVAAEKTAIPTHNLTAAVESKPEVDKEDIQAKEIAPVSAESEDKAKEDAEVTVTKKEAEPVLATLDDAKVEAWITKHQFQVVQTLFRTDIEGKEIHANVGGYQKPYDLVGYQYLSTIVTTTEQGPALVHIYREASYMDQSIVRTEYLDAASGKKIQADQVGQAFQASIGDRHYYNGLVVEENGEKVYKIFYLTNEDYVSYAGSDYYVRLTDYTRFIDQATGQEIALQQFGFVPIFEVAGYRYLSAEIIEENGVSYFIQSFEKEGKTTNSLEETVAKGSVKTKRKVNDKATDKPVTRPRRGDLPFTGERSSKWKLVGVILSFVIVIGVFLKERKSF